MWIIIINVYNYVYMIIYVYLLTYTSLNKIESNGLIMTRSPVGPTKISTSAAGESNNYGF